MAEYRVRWHDKVFRLDRVFQFGGRRYRCYSDDFAAVRFLERLELDRATMASTAGEQPRQPPRLLLLRDDFRRLAADQPIAGLILCLIRGDMATRRLSLWLLGRCGNSRAIPALRLFATHSLRALRLAAVQSLRRLRARAELTEIAEFDPDPWIRQYAAAATGRTFGAHLRRFLEDDASRVAIGEHQTPRSMPLVWNVPELARQPPKPAHLIREILARISRLLRGNGTGSKPA
jgi:hypothetical protein